MSDCTDLHLLAGQTFARAREVLIRETVERVLLDISNELLVENLEIGQRKQRIITWV